MCVLRSFIPGRQRKNCPTENVSSLRSVKGATLPCDACTGTAQAGPLENRKKYLEKGERTKRTHRPCNLGGTIESLAPEVKDLTRTEMTELMALFHLSATQTKRSAGQSAITSAAYRAGERLYSEYYGEYSDYKQAIRTEDIARRYLSQ